MFKKIVVITYFCMLPGLMHGLENLTQLAEMGNETAAFGLATAYQQGRTVPQDDTLAIKYAALAGERGLPILDKYINIERGYNSDDVLTNQRLRTICRALAQYTADPVSRYLLGAAYYRRVPEKKQEGTRLLKEGAESGSQACMFMYAQALRDESDFDGAIALLKKLEDNFEKDFQLGYTYLQKGDIQAGLKLIEKAGKQGFVLAQQILGNAYLTGLYGDKNLNKAKYWYTMAMKAGDVAEAATTLGTIAAQENKVEEATRFYKIAADSEQAPAVALYNYGLTLLKKHAAYEEGLKYLRRAAEKDYPQALFWLGSAYYNGDFGLAKDPEMADSLFKRILNLDKNNPAVMYMIAQLYHYGYGVPQDFVQYKDLIHKVGKMPNRPRGVDAVIARLNANELMQEEQELAETATPLPRAKPKNPTAKPQTPSENIDVSTRPQQEPVPASTSRPIDSDFVLGLIDDYNARFNADDGSRITDIDFSTGKITINDPRNKSTIVVSFDERSGYFPFKNPNFRYDNRVAEYFLKSHEDLLKSGKTQDDIDTHGFAKMMDFVIYRYGKKRLRPNMDNDLSSANYVINGTITLPDRTVKGTFEYTFGGEDASGHRLFHRFFRPVRR